MIVDAHIHFDALAAYPAQMADLARGGADQFCILVVDRYTAGPDQFKQAHGLWMKTRTPERAFLFGGIDWSGVFDAGKDAPDEPLVEQAARMKAVGFDGLKLLTGKPNVRKAVGLPLDGPEMRPLFTWLEETGFPVLWHVGDPPEFWSEKTVPLWARTKGWWYDNSHPPKSQIDQEIAAVLARHPRLRLILPHFFFLADRLDEADRLLDLHPNIFLDLAPGVEWMHHLSANRAGAREFFSRHADRIIYGTDMGMMENATHPGRGPAIRRFLETDEVFPVPEDIFMWPDERPPLHGLGLDTNLLPPIYAGNFHRCVGAENPVPLRRDALVPYLEKLASQARQRGEATPVAQCLLEDPILQTLTP